MNMKKIPIIGAIPPLNIQWCGALQRTRWRPYLKQFVPALEANFLEKLPKLVALQIFQSSHLSCGESLNHNTLSQYY